MYRIAVIQNGVEMQHSGYVDAIPLYRGFARIGKNHAEFTRFSGVNIGELFSNGENYLLEFDALILGTNATSDDDVYNVLRQEQCKDLLAKFIDLGKGVLICSQKKYQRQVETSETQEYKVVVRDSESGFSSDFSKSGTGEFYYHREEIGRKQNSHKRISAILPEHYEYIVDERPSGESSKEGKAKIVKSKNYSQIQKCILRLPNEITDTMIEAHCRENAFQTHFYRDVIHPCVDSAYTAIIVDRRNASDVRNLLMVAVPQKKERIVISTMALDWAGHESLLENIVNYLTRGIPHTAFVHKDHFENNEMKVLTMDAELSKVGYSEYASMQTFCEMADWHSLVVFSPDYSENEVYEAWQKIKVSNPFTKVYHYRRIQEGNELVLVKYSNNTYIEQQKIDVLAWLHSKRGKRLWDNSLWKTYDVAKLLYSLHDSGCVEILSQISESVTEKDDNDKSHYKAGCYDGVLAPTCGVMEILYWTCIELKKAAGDPQRTTSERQAFTELLKKTEENLQQTKKYLLGRYPELSTNNKMFVIRSFYHCDAIESLHSDFKCIEEAIFDLKDIKDITDIDLCLRAEIALILFKLLKVNKMKGKLLSLIQELCGRQLQNGKWDNLGNTANILNFLLPYRKTLLEIFKDDPMDQKCLILLDGNIDRGIAAVKTAYSSKYFNWENNIVTTANALLALCLYDASEYQSKDFLKDFIEESNNASSYNALNLALRSLDLVVDERNQIQKQLYDERERRKQIEDHNSRIYRHLYVASSIAGFSLFGLVSVFILLAVKYFESFKGLIGEVFLWVPIAIGLAITPIIVYLIKLMSTVSMNKKQKKEKIR